MEKAKKHHIHMAILFMFFLGFLSIITAGCGSDGGGGGVSPSGSPSASPTATTGIVMGKVMDINGSGLASVNISFGDYSTTTNESGFFTVNGVVPGNYTVTASKAGFAAAQRSITVFAGDVTFVNITLLAQ